MIEITIKRITTTSHKETKNYITEKTPTAIKKSDYNGREETVFSEKYELREVDVSEITTLVLLSQNVEDDKFVMANVVKAINGL
jgi:hypothetical protein